MSLNNNILHSQGFHHNKNSKNARPKKMNPADTRKEFITQKLEKQLSIPDKKCPPGTRWHRKLRQCIDKGNIELLKQNRKGYKPPANESRAAARDSLRNALRNYGRIDPT